MCLIADLLNDYSTIIKLIETCLGLVKKAEHMIASGALNVQTTTLMRCLYLLGLFGQHANTGRLNVRSNVSGFALIASSLSSFTKSVVPETLRKSAVTSYGISSQQR